MKKIKKVVKKKNKCLCRFRVFDSDKMKMVCIYCKKEHEV